MYWFLFFGGGVVELSPDVCSGSCCCANKGRLVDISGPHFVPLNVDELGTPEEKDGFFL